MFEQAVKRKLFWVHTNAEAAQCFNIDRFYTVYTATGRWNQFEGTRKWLERYKRNVRAVRDKQAKL